jgi:DNA-binding MarR family transcriptional regulator
LWVAAAVTQTDVVDDLVRRDWAQTDGTTYRLTAEGAAAHAAITEQVAALQADSLRGISEAERRTTLEVLARIAGNLER